MKIYPVIHYLDEETARNEAALAFECGATGIFLIAHHGHDGVLPYVAGSIRNAHKKFVGVNLLSETFFNAAMRVHNQNLDAVWLDYAGFSSAGIEDEDAIRLELLVSTTKLKVFAGVAFKYRRPEIDPVAAALLAHNLGFIPTTTGVGTGNAPNLEKIKSMATAVHEKGGELAIASGITPDNISEYISYADHILVATGISLDDHHLNSEKLKLLIKSSDR